MEAKFFLCSGEQREGGKMSERSQGEQFFSFIAIMAITFAFVFSLFASIPSGPALVSLSFGLMASIFIMAAFLMFAKHG